MSTFRFKQFSVTNDISPMKVNTDGVLLGAAMTIFPTDRRLLDIGTGTGTIALMAAQRLSACDAAGEEAVLAFYGVSGGGAVSGDAGGSAFGDVSGKAGGSDDDAASGIATVSGDAGGSAFDDVSGKAGGSDDDAASGIATVSGDAGGSASGDVSGKAAPFSIDAIDIDAPSASEAAANFAASPWAAHLHAHHTALADFLPRNDVPETADTPETADAPDGAGVPETADAPDETGSYDLIFSNPPYYDDSLLNPDARKSEARHTVSLSFRELLNWSAQHLAENGHIAIILPADREHELLRYARMHSLHPFRILRIRTTERKAPARVIVELAARRTATPEESLLTIHTKEGYSAEYLALTRDFYLWQ